MGEVVFRVPSKAIQYGYVEVRAEVPDETTFKELAESYVEAVTEFREAEAEAFQAYKESKEEPSEPAPLAPVEPDEELSREDLEDEELSREDLEDEELSREDLEYAAANGPEDIQRLAEDLLTQGFGATKISEEPAPWAVVPWAASDQESKPKPWENDKKAKSVATEIDW